MVNYLVLGSNIVICKKNTLQLSTSNLTEGKEVIQRKNFLKVIN